MAVGWYVAKIHRGKEAALQQQLEPVDIHVYHPRIIVQRSGRRRLEYLFPSYVFLQGDPKAESWVTAQRARGLKYLLGSDREPTPVDGHIVDTIVDRVKHWNAGGWREIFQPGQPVVIDAGPMKGVEAVFLQYHPARERCRILLSSLALQHEAEIDVSMISTAGKSLSPPRH